VRLLESHGFFLFCHHPYNFQLKSLSSIKKKLAKIIIILPLIFLTSNLAKAGGEEESNYLSLSAAVFDVLQNSHTSIEGRVEFRLYRIPWIVKPLSGFMTNGSGSWYLYAGLLFDIPISPFFYVTPSFAPGLYYMSDCKDLGWVLQFRSQIELAIKLESNLRFGLSFNHISNASLGIINPGVESLALFFQFPL
jgi:hypothetical protein